MKLFAMAVVTVLLVVLLESVFQRVRRLERAACTCEKPDPLASFTNTAWPRIEAGLPIRGPSMTIGGVIVTSFPVYISTNGLFYDPPLGKTNFAPTPSELRAFDASLRPSLEAANFRDLLKTNRLILSMDAEGTITYEQIPKAGVEPQL